MTFEHRLPLGRTDVGLSPEQTEAVARVARGVPLSPQQRGALRAAATYASGAAAATAQAALDEDAPRQKRRGRR